VTCAIARQRQAEDQARGPGQGPDQGPSQGQGQGQGQAGPATSASYHAPSKGVANGIAKAAAIAMAAESGPHCPYLQETQAQYCAAAPGSKYIPCTQPEETRCGSSAHRYCEVFQSAGDGPVDPAPLVCPGVAGGEKPMQADLGWTANHMWCDVAEDGMVHIGVDGFLTEALGAVEAVSLPTICGSQCPMAVLRVQGVDLPMIFPHEISILAANNKVKVSPRVMIGDPYRQGWLYQGRAARPAGGMEGWPQGLLRGRQATEWMKAERARLSAFVQTELSSTGWAAPVVMADGGTAVPGVARSLTREGLFKLFNNFFSPYPARGEAR